MSFYLAIDQGTHASRACLFDHHGEMLCAQTQPVSLQRISASRVEQDAGEILCSVQTVIRNLLDEMPEDTAITACGIATQRASVLAWHVGGRAASPVLSWQDTRGAAQLATLAAQNKTIQRLTGLPPSAHYGASKLHDLATETGQDGQKNNAGNACLTPLISFLLHHLLENKPCIVDHANAQRTQLLDLTRLQWSETLTKLFAVPVQALPACVPVLSSSPGGHGLLAGTTMPVRAISGDQNAALYGTGDLQPDCALVNIGSGAFVMRLLPQYTASEKLLTSIACSSQQQVQYLREGTINGAGSALDWLAKKHPDNAIPTHLPAWLQTIEHPPVFINAVGGLGSPWWRSDITPCFIRAGDHRPVEEATVAGQAVAVVESIVFLVMENLAMMQREHAIQRLRISGGLSQLDGLCQRLADLSGLPVERVEQAEATARGIAWLASGSSKAWPASFKLFSPADNSGLNKRYQVLITELKKRTA